MWASLADPHLVDPLVTRIATSLTSCWSVATEQPGLLVGRAGVAMFFVQRARETGLDADRQRAGELIQDLFDELSVRPSFTFCAGLAGAAWLLRDAATDGLIDVDLEAVLEDADESLRARMLLEASDGHYDFLYGALGCAFYLLEIPQAPANRRALSALVDALDHQALHDGERVSWRTHRDYLVPDENPGKVNLGLAHGVPSVIGVLARLIECDINADRASRLMAKAVRFVLDHAVPRTSAGASRYPAMSGEPPDVGCRLAWCYGDLGIAASFWRAGRVASRADWLDASAELLDHSATRRDPADTGVLDASLCHGSAGLALIFARLGHLTGRAMLRDAASFWLDNTCARVGPDHRYAGFYTANADADDVVTNVSMLMGIAGIGLTLMSLSSGNEPTWQRALLVP